MSEPTVAEVRKAIKKAPAVLVEVAVIEDIRQLPIAKATVLRDLEGARGDSPSPWGLHWFDDGDLLLTNTPDVVYPRELEDTLEGRA